MWNMVTAKVGCQCWNILRHFMALGKDQAWRALFSGGRA